MDQCILLAKLVFYLVLHQELMKIHLQLTRMENGSFLNIRDQGLPFSTQNHLKDFLEILNMHQVQAIINLKMIWIKEVNTFFLNLKVPEPELSHNRIEFVLSTNYLNNLLHLDQEIIELLRTLVIMTI